MNTTDDQSDTCPDCGATRTQDPHVCGEADPGAASGPDPHISIPASLWDTGLVKPVRRRPASQDGEGADGAPTQVISGSLYVRPDDLAADQSHESSDKESDEMAKDADETSPDSSRQSPSPFTPPPLTLAEITRSVATPPATQSRPSNPSTVVAEPDEPVKKRSKLWLLILVFVLLAVAAVAGWQWWQRGQDEPISDAFAASNAAFVAASESLEQSTSIDEVVVTAVEFEETSALLTETLELAEGRNSSLSTSARRAAETQLQISDSVAQLSELGPDDYTAWGDVRGTLRLELGRLAGMETDIVEAGGSPEGQPTAELIDSVDVLVVESATTFAENGTDRVVKDLNVAKKIKELRTAGERAETSADVITGAVESLADTEVDTELLIAHLGVQAASAEMTELRPNSLNQWTQISTKITRAAASLPEPQPVIDAVAQADVMVTEASEAWDEWKQLTVSARTQKQEDQTAVRDARVAVNATLDEFETLDTELAAFIADSGSLRGEGTESQAFRRLDAAATARTELSAEVGALGTPAEVAEEIAAIRAALDANAASIRAAADAAATCVEECEITETPAWITMAQSREAEATAVVTAVTAWRKAVPGALKEIRKRDLPPRPQI